MFETAEIVNLMLKWLYTTIVIFGGIFGMSTYIEYEQKQRLKDDRNV